MTNKEKIKQILKEKKLIQDWENFKWKTHSYLIPEHCPQLINHKKFNWNDYEASLAIIEHLTELTSNPRFNWNLHGKSVARLAPDYLKPEKVNWWRITPILVYFHPLHKLLDTHALWGLETIETIAGYSRRQFHRQEPPHNKRHPIWEKVNLNLLLNPEERPSLLKKVHKNIKLEKL